MASPLPFEPQQKTNSTTQIFEFIEFTFSNVKRYKTLIAKNSCDLLPGWLSGDGISQSVIQTKEKEFLIPENKCKLSIHLSLIKGPWLPTSKGLLECKNETWAQDWLSLPELLSLALQKQYVRQLLKKS
jgi:hypothetical protein